VSVADPLADLMEAVRREAHDAAVEAVRSELARLRPAKTEGKRLLSLNELRKRYGVGRGEGPCRN
jgi:hypothetical protein